MFDYLSYLLGLGMGLVSSPFLIWCIYKIIKRDVKITFTKGEDRQ